jgi:cytochrome c553
VGRRFVQSCDGFLPLAAFKSAAASRHGYLRKSEWKEYVALRLKMYATGDRRNDVYGRMREIASKLTPTEINGLATYYRAGFR